MRAKAWSVNVNADASTATREGAARGLLAAAEHILKVANRDVPVGVTGDLGRSGKASVDEASLRAAVSYDTEYAVTQHESMNLTHDAGRGPKWLENAFNSERGDVAKIIAKEIRL